MIKYIHIFEIMSVARVFSPAIFIPPNALAQQIGNSNYLGVAGNWGDLSDSQSVKFEGLFSNRSRYRMADVTDGTSNVLLFGEAIGAKPRTRPVDGHTWMGSGILITANGLNGRGKGDLSGKQSFTSEHSSSVQFCFADGSVRRIAENIDIATYWAFGGKHDAQPISWEAVH